MRHGSTATRRPDSPRPAPSRPARAYTRAQVCELDIIFNFEKAYFLLDEFLLAGEVQESSKRTVLKAVTMQDQLQEGETDRASEFSTDT